MQITINNLSKVYSKNKAALKNINLTIENGMIGLLGPNGAGKTTLMRILVTLLKPSSGSVNFDDWDLQKNRGEIRSVIRYLPQKLSLFPNLKTWEFLDYTARLAGMEDKQERALLIEKILDQVGLLDVKGRKANKLSGGMKRRLGIAQALIGKPKIIIIDEPTTGLDPEERIRFRNLLADISIEDVIIILSTHIVGDIISTCNNMILLNKGEVVYTGSPQQLREKAIGHTWKMKISSEELDRVKNEYQIVTTKPLNGDLEVEVVSDSENLKAAEQIEPNLEHAYIYFMEYLKN